jgi:hypothetical protein
MSYYDDADDDGTMPRNVQTLADAVIGHKIVSVEKNVKTPGKDSWYQSHGTAITLDNGKKVFLINTDDCCAYTELKKFLLHPESIDHMITGVEADTNYTTWHIFADMGDVLELTVGWSCGNPFYYSYGFKIQVYEPEQWETEWLKFSEG